MNDEMLEATLPQTMTTPTSDCPRTDKLERVVWFQGEGTSKKIVFSDDARTLERELNEANKGLDNAGEQITEDAIALKMLGNELAKYKQVASELVKRLEITDNHLLHVVGPTIARDENLKVVIHYHKLTTQGEQKE